MSDAREVFVTGLRNAHALENQAHEMLERQVERMGDYPELQSRLRDHLRETKTQLLRLEQCLSNLGESTSSMKDTALGGRQCRSDYPRILAEGGDGRCLAAHRRTFVRGEEDHRAGYSSRMRPRRGVFFGVVAFTSSLSAAWMRSPRAERRSSVTSGSSRSVSM